jgi:hypothetical protein
VLIDGHILDWRRKQFGPGFPEPFLSTLELGEFASIAMFDLGVFPGRHASADSASMNADRWANGSFG